MSDSETEEQIEEEEESPSSSDDDTKINDDIAQSGGEECGCDQYENDEYDDEDDEDNCCSGKQGNQAPSCSECQMVEKLVAELVVKKVTDDEKPPPVVEPPKKKQLFKSKFGRYGRRPEDTNFEVIETEHGRFRGCCRHKAEKVEGMPGYKGAVSLYGLSEEQYQLRMDRLEKQEQLEQEKLEKLKETYKEKSHANESAFSSWLKNKSRAPVNRNKNMYDTKRVPRRRSLQKPPAKKIRTTDERKPGD